MATTEVLEDMHRTLRSIQGTGGRYGRYEYLVARAVEEAKIGGDVGKANVFATLALAEATALTEPDGKVEVTGSITVDQ